MHYLKVNASQKHLFSEERMKQASFFYVTNISTRGYHIPQNYDVIERDPFWLMILV